MKQTQGLSQGLSSGYEAPFVATLRAVRQREAQLANARAKLAEISAHVEDIRFALQEITGTEDSDDLPLEARVIMAQVNSLAAAMAAAATYQTRN